MTWIIIIKKQAGWYDYNKLLIYEFVIYLVNFIS